MYHVSGRPHNTIINSATIGTVSYGRGLYQIPVNTLKDITVKTGNVCLLWENA